MYTRNCEIKPGREFPEGMQRISLGVEYQGSGFYGFQAQKFTDNTIQGHLHRALSTVADEPITLVCAGRTDAGVHATGQVVHFDTLSRRPDKAWTRGVNALLPDGISIQWCRHAGPGFHARFSARTRTYRYLICNSDYRPAIMARQVTWQKRPLNLPDMVTASRHLMGEQDFSAFRAAQCQARHAVRRIDSLRFAEAAGLIVMEVTANAFLHHMVRNIVGALFAVGCGDKPVDWVAEVLASRNRNLNAATAPATGLYLVAVDYPPEFSLPEPRPGPVGIGDSLNWIT